MPQVILYQSRIGAFIGEGIAAGVPQHVRVHVLESRALPDHGDEGVDSEFGI